MEDTVDKPKSDDFKDELDLSNYLINLSNNLQTRHDYCGCDNCRFEGTLILGLKQIHAIYSSQILLIKQRQPWVAEILVRPIVEFVTDMLFINIDITRVGEYLAFERNIERFRWKKIKECKEENGESVDEEIKIIDEIEQNMKDEGLTTAENPKTWTAMNLFDRFDKVIKSDSFNKNIKDSIKGRNLRLKSKMLNAMPHFSSYSIVKFNEYENNPEFLKDSLVFSIDWIMILLEFIASHFNKPEMEEALLKFHKAFYS